MRIAVIGAGAVGLSVARELGLRGHEIYALEQTGHPGSGITSRNSEVIHAGLYYTPGSLKARLCIEGRKLLYDYATRSGVDHRACGKLVVATTDEEIPALEAIHQNALASGAEDLEMIDGPTARRLEPSVRCVAALASNGTGIVDASGYVRALRRDLERAGGTLALHAAVRGAEAISGGFRLVVDVDGEVEPFECDAVVNAAGLEADRVARLPLGEEPPDLPSHRFVKGNYVRVWWPSSQLPPRRLVYPLPNHNAPGLGIHLTVDLAGGLRLGPDTEDLGERVEDYAVRDEVAPRFEAAGRRYLEFPDGVSFTPDFAGIRPVRRDPSGSRDFYIAEESGRGLPGWVNCIGIESPGLTASPAIARYVAGLFEGREPEIGVG
jgi:L-2-hydroxyglutarate oxidase LhgO